MYNLGVYFFLTLFLPSSPTARRDGSRRLGQIRARTALLASNVLAVGVKYTHLYALGVDNVRQCSFLYSVSIERNILTRTALLASNAPAVGVKYTHLYTLGVW